MNTGREKLCQGSILTYVGSVPAYSSDNLQRYARFHIYVTKGSEKGEREKSGQLARWIPGGYFDPGCTAGRTTTAFDICLVIQLLIPDNLWERRTSIFSSCGKGGEKEGLILLRLWLRKKEEMIGNNTREEEDAVLLFEKNFPPFSFFSFFSHSISFPFFLSEIDAEMYRLTTSQRGSVIVD